MDSVRLAYAKEQKKYIDSHNNLNRFFQTCFGNLPY